MRRPGAGRKKLAETGPGLVPALLALAEDSGRGDPGSPLMWTTKGVKHLAGELTARGHRCSPQTVGRLPGGQGFSARSSARVGGAGGTRTGMPGSGTSPRRPPGIWRGGQPVISVDAPKNEQAGGFARAGREWRPEGSPVAVRSRDFAGPQGGHAIPYGICDAGADTGFVNAGTGPDTAASAVESVRRWRELIGTGAYPDARRLLVTCDAGGASHWRNRAWKAGLAEFAQQAGPEITACHFPPGTRPAPASGTDRAPAVLPDHPGLAGPPADQPRRHRRHHRRGHHQHRAGRHRRLDPGRYPTGTRISDEQINQIEDRALPRHRFHGEWNYTVGPAPRPAPRPPPPPAPPGPDLDAPAHPAPTGMSRAAFDDLTAGLELPYAAAREQRLHPDRGRARRGRPKGPAAPLKPSLPAYPLAAIYRHRLSTTCPAIADPFAVGHSTISVATRHINGLLTDQDTAITPGPRRIRSPQDLPDHAARYSITITAPAPAGTPPDDTLTIPTCP